MHGAGEVFGSFQSALNESFVDDPLDGDVREFTSLPHLHLFSHRLKVALHAIHTHRDAGDEGERLRVFREHRSEHAWNNVSESTGPTTASSRGTLWNGEGCLLLGAMLGPDCAATATDGIAS